MEAPSDPTASAAGPVASGVDPSATGGHTDASRVGALITTPDGDYESLSRKVLLVWRAVWVAVGAAVTLLAVIIGAAAVDLPAAVRIALPVVVAVVSLASVILVPAAAYRRWRYLVTDDGLDIQHGLVVRRQASIPHFRVQHVDIRRGPIQRQLGIVSLTISTASQATDAELPGLDPARAETIRRRVLDRAEADDGV